MDTVTAELDGLRVSNESPKSHEKYTYTPLNADSDDIRILDLAPSTTWESQIYVRLRTICLTNVDDQSSDCDEQDEQMHEFQADECDQYDRTRHYREQNASPGIRYITERYQRNQLEKFGNRSRDDYEALSYVWGSIENMATFLVTTEGLEDLGELKVTQNFEEALRHLRLGQHLRVLWVDAICINQGGDPAALQGRGRQVAMMAAIYSKAFRVRCWLGPSSHDCQLAIDCIHLVRSHVAMDFITSELVALSDDRDWTAAVNNPGSRANISPEAIASLTNLIQRPYFERLWIWQEIRFDQGRAYLMLGKERILWPRFCAALRYCCNVFFPNQISGRELYDRLGLVSRLVNPLSRTFVHAIDSMRSCRCSDQRDRVYTAQAFETARLSLRMAPDYIRSVFEVWTDMIRKYMAETSFSNLSLTWTGHPAMSLVFRPGSLIGRSQRSPR